MMFTDVADKLQVGTLVPVVGETAQVSPTIPVNPPIGDTVMVEVLFVVAPAVPMLMFPLLVTAKLVEPAGEPVTTAAIASV